MGQSMMERHLADVLLLIEDLPDAVSALEIAHEEKPSPDDERIAAAMREKAVELVMLARGRTRERVELWLEAAQRE